jgi:23S rRNA pseudouridine1911/1915/1917 synthase
LGIDRSNGVVARVSFLWRVSVVSFSVVFEDNHLIVVDKPTGLATMGTAQDEPSLAREVQAYLKQKYSKPGNVYLGVVSRLDTVTSGLVVFARTSKAASRLTVQFQERSVLKWYVAAVPTVPGKMATYQNSPPNSPWFDTRQVVWEDIIWKDEAAHRMRIRSRSSIDVGLEPRGGAGDRDEDGDAWGQSAKLAWRFLGRQADLDLLLVRLTTGRKHQIRTQFAARGVPILGDRKYGSLATFPAGIALHAWRLEFWHPITKNRLTFCRNVPRAWGELPAFTVEPDVPVDRANLVTGAGKLLQWLGESRP